MKRFAILALAATACAPQGQPAANDTPVAEASPVDVLQQCDGTKANALLGRIVDAAMQAEAMRLVGARTTRVIPPGAAVTMDYRGDRLNIDTDGANKVIRFHCS